MLHLSVSAHAHAQMYDLARGMILMLFWPRMAHKSAWNINPARRCCVWGSPSGNWGGSATCCPQGCLQPKICGNLLAMSFCGWVCSRFLLYIQLLVLHGLRYWYSYFLRERSICGRKEKSACVGCAHKIAGFSFAGSPSCIHAFNVWLLVDELHNKDWSS